MERPTRSAPQLTEPKTTIEAVEHITAMPTSYKLFRTAEGLQVCGNQTALEVSARPFAMKDHALVLQGVYNGLYEEYADDYAISVDAWGQPKWVQSSSPKVHEFESMDDAIRRIQKARHALVDQVRILMWRGATQ